MAFRYKTRKKALPAGGFRRPKLAVEQEEELTGYFGKYKATRGEEFFMTEVSRRPNTRGVAFRVTLGAPRGEPGWLELDGLVQTITGFRAFEIDDLTFVHKGAREQAEAVLKDHRRIAGLEKIGVRVHKIEHVNDADLKDRRMTRRTLEKLGL